MRPPCPPFSPCWCELNPNNPRCVEELSISSGIFTITIVLLITFVVFKVLKKNKKIKNNMNISENRNVVDTIRRGADITGEGF